MSLTHSLTIAAIPCIPYGIMARLWQWPSVSQALLFSFVVTSTSLPPLAAPPQTEGGGGDRTYEKCMNLARKGPDDVLEAALAWQDMNGGSAARHCRAVALFNLGQYEQTADGFKAAADTLGDAPATERAGNACPSRRRLVPGRAA